MNNILNFLIYTRVISHKNDVTDVGKQNGNVKVVQEAHGVKRKQGFGLASSADDIFYKRSFKGHQYFQKDSSCGVHTRNSKTHYLKKKCVCVFN